MNSEFNYPWLRLQSKFKLGFISFTVRVILASQTKAKNGDIAHLAQIVVFSQAAHGKACQVMKYTISLLSLQTINGSLQANEEHSREARAGTAPRARQSAMEQPKAGQDVAARDPLQLTEAQLMDLDSLLPSMAPVPGCPTFRWSARGMANHPSSAAQIENRDPEREERNGSLHEPGQSRLAEHVPLIVRTPESRDPRLGSSNLTAEKAPLDRIQAVTPQPIPQLESEMLDSVRGLGSQLLTPRAEPQRTARSSSDVMRRRRSESYPNKADSGACADGPKASASLNPLLKASATPASLEEAKTNGRETQAAHPSSEEDRGDEEPLPAPWGNPLGGPASCAKRRHSAVNHMSAQGTVPLAQPAAGHLTQTAPTVATSHRLNSTDADDMQDTVQTSKPGLPEPDSESEEEDGSRLPITRSQSRRQNHLSEASSLSRGNHQQLLPSTDVDGTPARIPPVGNNTAPMHGSSPRKKRRLSLDGKESGNTGDADCSNPAVEGSFPCLIFPFYKDPKRRLLDLFQVSF